MQEECVKCKKRINHGGTCMETVNGPCLGFEKDPRGRIIEAIEGLVYDFDENIEVGKWTNGAWETDNGYRIRYIESIRKIFYSEEAKTWVIKAYTHYFEYGDEDEDREYQLQKHLIDNHIKNVVLMHRKKKTKSDW